MEPKDIQRTVTEWQRHLGRKGGRSRSPAKLKAARANALRMVQINRERRLKGK